MEQKWHSNLIGEMTYVSAVTLTEKGLTKITTKYPAYTFFQIKTKKIEKGFNFYTSET